MRPLVLTVLLAGVACSWTPPGVELISQEALLADPPAGALILDVRTPEEFATSHVPNAVNIPHTELASRISELDVEKTSPIVVYCERGFRAGRAESVLLEAGYQKVLHLEGDMRAWRANDRPVAAP